MKLANVVAFGRGKEISLTLLVTALTCMVLAISSPKALAVVVGQIDTFEDGTTQHWFAGGPFGVPPHPPLNQPSGGPLGVDDNYLQLASTGTFTAGGRLVAINGTQWSGDYVDAGITRISMDLRNLGNTDLTVRLYLENPILGVSAPTDTALSDAFFLPTGGDWTHIEFSLDPASLTALQGDVDALLANVGLLRLIHGPDAVFPPPFIAGLLGVDNIRALGNVTAIPEPTTLALLGIGLAGLAFRRRNRAAD